MQISVRKLGLRLCRKCSLPSQRHPHPHKVHGEGGVGTGRGCTLWNSKSLAVPCRWGGHSLDRSIYPVCRITEQRRRRNGNANPAGQRAAGFPRSRAAGGQGGCFQHGALEIYRHFHNSVVGGCFCYHGNRQLKMGHVSLNWSYLHTNSLLLFVKSWHEFKACSRGMPTWCRAWYRGPGTEQQGQH